MMIRWSVWLVAAGLAVASCGQGPSDQPKAVESSISKSAGKIDAMALFKDKCAACHGDFGKGDGIVVAALNPKPADLTSVKVQKLSDADLKKAISDGRPGTTMISWRGQLSEEEITVLVQYLRMLGQKKLSYLPPIPPPTLITPPSIPGILR